MLEQFTAHITPFGKDRVVRVWLPDEIETARTAYPVLYMFDGHNLFRDEWATYGKCWGLADFLARWEKPIIVGGPECAKKGPNGPLDIGPGGIEALCGPHLPHNPLSGSYWRGRQFHGRADGTVYGAAL